MSARLGVRTKDRRVTALLQVPVDIALWILDVPEDAAFGRAGHHTRRRGLRIDAGREAVLQAEVDPMDAKRAFLDGSGPVAFGRHPVRHRGFCLAAGAEQRLA